uniref:Uncharacterized protein n=2 Tax=Anguilla anguilla TaxID=7936 RepID=A0A0E9QIH2_ANGAN
MLSGIRTHQISRQDHGPCLFWEMFLLVLTIRPWTSLLRSMAVSSV